MPEPTNQTQTPQDDDGIVGYGYNDVSPDGTRLGPDGKPVQKKSTQKGLSFDQLDPSQQGLAMLFFFLAMLLDPKMLEKAGLDKLFGSILGLDPEKGESFGQWQDNALKSGKSAPEIAKGHDYKNFNFGEAAALAASDTPILELIGKHESGGDYNNYYGRSKKGEKVDFTNMSIDQVLAWQRDHTKNDGYASSAAGKYQVIQDTLKNCKKEMGLSGSEKFDAAMQDRIAIHLMNKRGYQDFLKGNIDAEKFANNLSKEWASLPKNASGLSYYHGDGLNKAGVGWGELLASIKASRNTVRSPAFESQIAAQGGALVLRLPLDSKITSDFGHRNTGIRGASTDHGGIDMRATVGTPLLSQGPAQVAYAGPSSGYGNVAILNHGQGVFTVYGHIEADGLARTGTVLQKGQAFAKSGNEGVGNAPHLHFEVLIMGKDGRAYRVDPEKALGKDLSDPQIRQALITDAGYKTSRVFTARVDEKYQGDPGFRVAQQQNAPTPSAPQTFNTAAAGNTPPAPPTPAPTPVAQATTPVDKQTSSPNRFDGTSVAAYLMAEAQRKVSEFQEAFKKAAPVTQTAEADIKSDAAAPTKGLAAKREDEDAVKPVASIAAKPAAYAPA